MRSIEEIINRQLNRWEMEKNQRQDETAPGELTSIKSIVTVSRQRGSRGAYLAERLAEHLDYQLLHREVIDEICKSSGYRRRIIESLDARVRSKIELWFEAFFKGLYVDASDYFRHLYKVIMSVSEHGGIVVVGRAAAFILGREQGFHIRTVASLPKRVDNLVRFQGITTDEAEREIIESDNERAAFVSNNFRHNIDDPGVYDMIINMSYIDVDDAVKMAVTGIRAKSLIVHQVL